MCKMNIFETNNSKSVDFSHTDAAFFKTFIYEIYTIYSWTIRIMCYIKV